MFLDTTLWWAVGLIWWVALTIPRPNIAIWAPVATIPWLLMGVMVGGVNSLLRGYWIPVVAALGTLGGGIYSAVNDPYDGWIFISMQVACFVGTIAGLAVGMFTRLIWGHIQGWEDSV